VNRDDYFSYYSKSVGASVRCLRDWLFVYLTICGRAKAGGRKGGVGGTPPNGSFSIGPKMLVA
jgi:hypothetical protein